MTSRLILRVLLAVGLSGGLMPTVAAEDGTKGKDKPVVAMIGTGTLASTFGKMVSETISDIHPVSWMR